MNPDQVSDAGETCAVTSEGSFHKSSLSSKLYIVTQKRHDSLQLDALSMDEKVNWSHALKLWIVPSTPEIHSFIRNIKKAKTIPSTAASYSVFPNSSNDYEEENLSVSMAIVNDKSKLAHVSHAIDNSIDKFVQSKNKLKAATKGVLNFMNKSISFGQSNHISNSANVTDIGIVTKCKTIDEPFRASLTNDSKVDTSNGPTSVEFPVVTDQTLTGCNMSLELEKGPLQLSNLLCAKLNSSSGLENSQCRNHLESNVSNDSIRHSQCQSLDASSAVFGSHCQSDILSSEVNTTLEMEDRPFSENSKLIKLDNSSKLSSSNFLMLPSQSYMSSTSGIQMNYASEPIDKPTVDDILARTLSLRLRFNNFREVYDHAKSSFALHIKDIKKQLSTLFDTLLRDIIGLHSLNTLCDQVSLILILCTKFLFNEIIPCKYSQSFRRII